MFDRISSASARCINCGCTDHQACELGCWWLVVDYSRRKGVCSSCPAAKPRFQKLIAEADAKAAKSPRAARSVGAKTRRPSVPRITAGRRAAA